MKFSYVITCRIVGSLASSSYIQFLKEVSKYGARVIHLDTPTRNYIISYTCKELNENLTNLLKYVVSSSLTCMLDLYGIMVINEGEVKGFVKVLKELGYKPVNLGRKVICLKNVNEESLIIDLDVSKLKAVMRLINKKLSLNDILTYGSLIESISSCNAHENVIRSLNIMLNEIIGIYSRYLRS